jgi:hypothetical protein
MEREAGTVYARLSPRQAYAARSDRPTVSAGS